LEIEGCKSFGDFGEKRMGTLLVFLVGGDKFMEKPDSI
jgi:hypothetical protein